jgi:RNA-directed DNA polymerase
LVPLKTARITGFPGAFEHRLDLDVKAYFDSIDWELMLRAVRRHTNRPWVLLYIERWLKAPMQMEDGSIVPRSRERLREGS